MFAETTPDLTDRRAMVSQFHSYCHHIARRMLKAGTPLDRTIGDEDLGQEIAANALRWFHRFNQFRGKFVTWLWQVARTTAHECRYHATRPVRAASTWRAAPADSLRETPDHTAPALDRRIRSAEFWAIVGNTLTERERQVVQAHFIDGKDLKDIASDLGIARRTANKLRTKALNKLRPFGDYLQELARTN